MHRFSQQCTEVAADRLTSPRLDLAILRKPVPENSQIGVLFEAIQVRRQQLLERLLMMVGIRSALR
ncbi:MAG: hypothetical protein WBQ65_21710, partial [Bryobacteraceae bacterium]